MLVSDSIAARLQRQSEAGLSRARREIECLYDNRIRLTDGRELLNFSSNDYLGLANDRRAQAKIFQGSEDRSIGSSSSALICGYHQEHRQAEEQFASFVERDKAILVGSGFLANLGVMSAVCDSKTRILLDRLAHASLIDGAQLSGSRFHRFLHNDFQSLQKLVERHQSDPLLVATESLFSMDGDTAPLDNLAAVCRNQATLMVDDAHGFGVLGRNGRGGLSAGGLNQAQAPVLVTPLGKAIGSYGAFISGPVHLIEAIEHFARSYIYSTALPPAHAQATSLALKMLEQEEWRRDQLFENIEYANRVILELGLDLVSQEATPIRAILVGLNDTATRIRDELLDMGYLVSAIRPPTVPAGTARIRFSLNALHRKEDIRAVLMAISQSLASKGTNCSSGAGG